MVKRKRREATLFLLAALALVSTACNPQKSGDTGPAPKTRLSIATGGTGGVYYPYGGGIAKIIGEHVSNVEATAEVTAASVDNLKFIRNRNADLAFTTADTLAEAVNGTGAFSEGKLPIRTVAALYLNTTHLITLASSGIRNVSELKGKIVSIGAPGSGTEITAQRVLKAHALSFDDIKRQGLGVTESADALKDGKIDAFFWNGGLPTAAILDLSHTPGIAIRVLPTGDAIESMRKTYGESLYVQGVIPKGAYPGMDADVSVINIPNLLVVHEEMSDRLVYDITRTLFEHHDELAAIHPEAAKLKLSSAVQGSPAPFHPGAIRYYEEQHIWPK